MVRGFALLLGVALAFAGYAAARPAYDLAPVTADMQRLVATHSLDGASLRLGKGGAVVYREYFGTYGANKQVPIASASKWLSALTLARLVERGVLRWESPVGEFLPDAPVATRGITLAQLYSHTSGILSGETDCLSNRFIDLQTCARQILAEPLVTAPGTTFAYGGNSMQVAGAMAEVAAGRSWDDIFIAQMVQPLGLTGTDWTAGAFFAGYVRNANPRVAGGARSTLEDYGRVLDMVLAGGLHDGQSYLGPQTLAHMAVDRTLGLALGNSPEPTYGYGLGQWVEARDAFGATYRVSSPGAFGFTPWVDWQNGSNGVLMVLGSRQRMAADLTAIERRALQALDFQRRTQGIKPPPAADQLQRTPAPAPRGKPVSLDATRRAH